MCEIYYINNRRQKGFALPTILISSIMMLTVLLASVISTSALSNSITKQFYEKIANDASIAGKIYAESCIAKNLGVPWASPLKPGTDCMGDYLPTCPASPADAPCHYLSISDGVGTTFSVEVTKLDSSGNVADVNSSGLVNLIRTSDGSTWMTYSKSTAKTDDSLKVGDSTWKEIVNSSYDTCGIASDNLAYCWGNNANGAFGSGSSGGSLVPIPVNTEGVLRDKTIKTISSSSSHSCVIASDNLAYCWGYNSDGQLGNNSTTESNIPVAVDMSGVLAGKTIKSISAGNQHTCAVASDNNVYCWGYNGTGGRLGNDSTTSSSVPVAVNTAGSLSGKKVRSITAGWSHNCAIASDNLAYCWGDGSYGKLGRNTTSLSRVPVPVNTDGVFVGKTIKAISAGGEHTCAIASDNLAYCWGYNESGRLGNNSTVQSLIPVPVDTSDVLSSKTIVSISAGYDHSCAIASDNKAYCWGDGSDSQLGNNSTLDSLVPVVVDDSGILNNKTVRSIKAEYNNTCVIASDNKAYCWGWNIRGQLGNNTMISSSVPVLSNSAGTMRGLAMEGIYVGRYHTCAVASDNLAYCWGDNSEGQLGNNFTTDSLVPVAVNTAGVLSGKTIKSIAVGEYHTCAIASDNLAYCWGSNYENQLGNNSSTDSPVPVTVSMTGGLAGKTVKSISVGDEHSCAILSDNQAYCWGSNGSGQLGNNSTTNSPVPVAVNTAGVLSGKTINSIMAGYTHTCAIASDNQAYCWGSNTSGELGNNSTTDSLVPVAVNIAGALNGKTVNSITVGVYPSCVIASDNLAYCWGSNYYGALGIDSGDSSPVLVPTPVSTSGVLNGKTVNSIMVGALHGCVIASDNKSYCWGRGVNGQLGDNSEDYSPVPVAVSTSGVLNGKTMNSIVAGGEHTCAIASDNNAYCWGDNRYGQLGDNSTINGLVPILTNVYSISHY